LTSKKEGEKKNKVAFVILLALKQWLMFSQKRFD